MVFFLVILLIYALLIIKFISGWRNMPIIEKQKTENVSIFASIVVSCKNERTNLPSLFQSLQSQSYTDFEVILVDDGSTDGSWEYADQRKADFSNLIVIRNGGAGKKQAIRSAIHQTASELIITLDADTTFSEHWLHTIVRFYRTNPSDLIICPVQIDAGSRFLEHFQQLELASLVGNGAGAAEVGKPILCNGANLAFKRSAWLESEPELHFETPSGDDIFLLQSVKRRKGTVRFLKSREAIAYTRPKETIGAFLKQRKRWASKHAMYGDKQLLLTALTVFLISLSIVGSLIAGFFYPQFFWMFLILFFGKIGIDYLFFSAVKPFFKLRFSAARFVVFSLIYPFYIVFTTFGSIQKSKNW